MGDFPMTDAPQLRRRDSEDVVHPPGRRSRRSLARVALPVGLILMVAAGIGAVALVSAPPSSTTTGSADPSAAGGTASPTGSPTGSASAGPSATASATRPASGCAFTVTEGVCPIAPPAPVPAGKHWKISFATEFTGTSFDHSKLTPCFDWNTGSCTSSFNNGREHYQPSQVGVSDGLAHLIAAPLNPPYANSACQNGSCTYKAGLLSTARPNASDSKYLYTFTYGYVESRFRFPATRGFFTAFWMLPADPTYSYRSEIDILEELGNDPTTMFMTYGYNNRSQSYTPNKGQYNNGACPVKDYSKEYVRMGMDWEPGHIAWYIDGKKCGEFDGTSSQIENGPMQLILHMMVDNDWQRRWNVGLTDPTLTRELDVDYMRVYQQTPN
jgi:glycosyl hydrolase family 16